MAAASHVLSGSQDVLLILAVFIIALIAGTLMTRWSSGVWWFAPKRKKKR